MPVITMDSGQYLDDLGCAPSMLWAFNLPSIMRLRTHEVVAPEMFGVLAPRGTANPACQNGFLNAMDIAE
jgi:hypothetical protein